MRNVNAKRHARTKKEGKEQIIEGGLGSGLPIKTTLSPVFIGVV
ncbi:hypothetical protein Phi46:1_gp47 [Cellulophaga phage phi46:1]|nr:hypothetical protein Phi46:1_gp47 [Cellulophaga phage phi46:1]AGO47858.1 hypothetical protein Phi46:1_gp47 [Cellulophaga phage phi46:1]